MVSTAAMGLTELATFLVANGTYATLAEAVAALNIVVVEDVGLAGTALAVTGGAAPAVVGTVGQTALELAAQAELAATGTNVTTAGIGLLEGSGTTGAAAILGVDLGIVAAAAAPILGVSLGINLYESNPELWTKISQKLLPFCYPGTTQIPTWAEIAETAWETSIAKSIIEALKDLFEDEEIPIAGQASTGTADSSLVDGPISIASSATVTEGDYRHTYSGGVCSHVVYNSKHYLIIASPSAGSYTDTVVRTTDDYTYTRTKPMAQTYTNQGQTVYYARISTVPEDLEPYYGDDGAKVAWTTIYGNITTTDYPDGISQWTGTTPSEIPETKPAYIDYDPDTGTGTTQPMTPISIPQEIPPAWTPGKPVPTPDPVVQPDPTKTTDPDSQVKPYIMPLPIPWETTNPDEDTEPDPTLDPTNPRPPTEIVVNPPISLGPEPTGISPWPTMPGTPPAFAQNVGLVTVYHPTDQQLYAFERWLWVTYADATIDKIWNNPFDGIIGLFELYCTPTDIGNRNIHSGFLDSGINSAIISRYTEIDCGTLGIPEYYGNYLDYSPYSKAHIYLPFIGIQELNVDDIVGHTVNVTYRIDEYNGSCIAMITVAKVTEVNGETVEYSNTMYQFSGNCSVDLPITGGSQASIKAGMMTANAYQNAAIISAGASLIGGIGSLLMGNIGGAIGGLGNAAASYAYGQANALSNMLSGKSTVQKSGGFGSSHGALGIKVPFITVTRPKQIQVPNYEELYGFPAHKMVTVGACTGFLRCREVHVVSATANDEEKSIIENLLKTGVYVTE